jgi:hypothetical protein
MDQPKLKSHQPDDSPTQTIWHYTSSQAQMQIIFFFFLPGGNRDSSSGFICEAVR